VKIPRRLTAAWLNMQLVLAWVLWRTGSLRVTIICHAFANWAGLVLLRFLV
jgi:membrane protease YdiL (CAAX protease family)